MFEKWAKTSGPPPSCSMKPKPFSALNHFTVPVVMSYLLRGQCPGPARCERHVAAMIAPPRETGKCKSVTAAPWRRGYSKAWEPQLQLKCHNITARGGVHGA